MALAPGRGVLPSGMSDWSMSEIGDITLDALGDNCDRLVHHNGAGRVNGFEAEGETHKKARLDVLNRKERNIDNKDSTKDIFNGNQETTFHYSLTVENSQSVNCLPSHASKSVLAFSHSPKYMDAIATFSFASDDTRTLDGYFSGHDVSTHGDGLFSDECTQGNTSVANEENLSHFPLETSPAETDIDLQVTEPKIRESIDIMDYDWPDVGSFDDVDKMLSYATFGQESSGNANELSWLSSSSYTADVSEDAFKLGLQSSYSDLNTLRDSLQTNIVNWPDNCLQTVDGDKVSDLDYDSLTNSFEADVHDKVDFPSKREVIMKTDEENQLDKKENVNTAEYARGRTSPIHDTVAQHDKQVHLSSTGKPKTSLCCYTGSRIQYVEPENSGSPHSPSERYIPLSPTVKLISTVKSLNEAKPPLLIHIPVEASNNGHQSLKILSPLSNSPTAIAARKIEKMHLEQHPHTEVPIGHPNQKPMCFSGLTNQDSSNKKQCEMKTPVGRSNHLQKCSLEQPREDIGSSSQADSSMACSGDILSSPKTFQQLQDVMNQLDIKTKLCIRDGLYRLAKSAEHRHTVDHRKSEGCCGNMDSSKHIEGDKPRRCHRYMDVEMETSTNPIDRSIVHLLFQRPFEHSSYPAEDAMPHKPLNGEAVVV